MSIALLLAMIGASSQAFAEGQCGLGSTPIVAFPTTFSTSGPGRVISVHTRTSDVYREWPWSCDDSQRDSPLTMNCEAWETCAVGAPFSNDVVTASLAKGGRAFRMPFRHRQVRL